VTTLSPQFDAHAIEATPEPADHGPALSLRAVSSRRSLLSLLNPVATARDLWRLRGLVGQFAVRNVAERNRGSYLGWVWTIIQPLLMLAVYTFVFAIVWQARWGGSVGDAKTSFALTVFAGLILFDIFGSSVGASPSTIVNNPNYVKKVVFPLEVLPLSTVLAGLIISCVGVLVLIVGKAVLGGVWVGGIEARFSRTLPFFPLVLPSLLMLAAGVSLALSALGVFLRDIRPLVQGLVLQVLFFMTPIFYPVDRIPEWLRGILSWNPLAVIVESGRRTLVLGQYPDWTTLGITTLTSLCVLILGYACFMKSKRGFADVL
jgi:lipopolysaccharide transport system permease protein